MPPDIGQGKAARKIAVAHLALARSQNTGAGVSGIHKKQSSPGGLLLWYKYRVEGNMRITFNPVLLYICHSKKIS